MLQELGAFLCREGLSITLLMLPIVGHHPARPKWLVQCLVPCSQDGCEALHDCRGNPRVNDSRSNVWDSINWSTIGSRHQLKQTGKHAPLMLHPLAYTLARTRVELNSKDIHTMLVLCPSLGKLFYLDFLLLQKGNQKALQKCMWGLLTIRNIKLLQF